MSDVMTISKRNAAGLEEVLRTLLLDSDNKVPAERLRIVGALADGAIIESGSNANGEYTRFANGLQICWRRNYSPTPSGDIHTWTFPAAFVSNPAIVTMGQWHSDEIWMPCMNGYNQEHLDSVTSTRLQYQIRSMSGVSYPHSGRFFDFVAIGKWK